MHQSAITEEERLEHLKTTRAKIKKKLADRISGSPPAASPLIPRLTVANVTAAAADAAPIDASTAVQLQTAQVRIQELEAMMMQQDSLPSMGTMGGEVLPSQTTSVATLGRSEMTKEMRQKVAWHELYNSLIEDEKKRDVNNFEFYSKADIGSHARGTDETNIKDVQLDYETCCADLDHKTKKALRRLDTDGNGKISTAELLHAGEDHQHLRQKVIFFVIIIALIALLLFASCYLAVVLSQPITVTPGGQMAVPGAPEKGKILETADATEKIPVAFAPLLSLADMGRVNTITVSNLASNKVPCATCPTKMVITVDVANKISDTKAHFYRTQGITVTIDRGLIKVANIPGQGSTVFDACGSASCSSIKIAGMNVAALKARARSLGYLNFGRRGEEKKCSTASPEKKSFVQEHKKALIAGGVATAGIAAVVIAKKTGAKEFEGVEWTGFPKDDTPGNPGGDWPHGEASLMARAEAIKRSSAASVENIP